MFRIFREIQNCFKDNGANNVSIGPLLLKTRWILMCTEKPRYFVSYFALWELTYFSILFYSKAARECVEHKDFL